MTFPDAIAVGYLLAAVLFILGLKALGRPRTARRGNLLGATGMFIAIAVTLLDRAIVDFRFLALGVAIGALVGALLALKVRMTGMPELVALFNGFGGAASVLVAGAAFLEVVDTGTVDDQLAVAAAVTVLVGAVTFTGSMVAFGKLRESLRWNGFSGLHIVRAATGAVALILVVGVVVQPDSLGWFWGLAAAGLLLGVLATIAIGGADMPVVIALLNAFSGVAASTTGFVLDNPLLIIAGSLVGASGLILTQIMCTAMNRSILDVVFSKAVVVARGSHDDAYGDGVTSTSAEEVAMLLEVASRVVIVPGYGLAVAQAQHAVRELMTVLEGAGAEVMFGIHPVAGRMPGHMNVLLAEAEIEIGRAHV